MEPKSFVNLSFGLYLLLFLRNEVQCLLYQHGVEIAVKISYSYRVNIQQNAAVKLEVSNA